MPALTFDLPKLAQTASTTTTFTVGTPSESGNVTVIPIAAQALAPTAVVSATTTTSPKKVTLVTPSDANIRVGSVISGGSFAGTEVVSAVTKNTAGRVTEFTYTGTGSVNASAANITVTDTSYNPVVAYLRVTQTAGGSSLTIKADLLPLPGSASSESSGAETATIALAVDEALSVSKTINVAEWRRGLGFSNPA
jgi:hypothetical protein